MPERQQARCQAKGKILPGMTKCFGKPAAEIKNASRKFVLIFAVLQLSDDVRLRDEALAIKETANEDDSRSAIHSSFFCMRKY